MRIGSDGRGRASPSVRSRVCLGLLVAVLLVCVSYLLRVLLSYTGLLPSRRSRTNAFAGRYYTAEGSGRPCPRSPRSMSVRTARRLAREPRRGMRVATIRLVEIWSLFSADGSGRPSLRSRRTACAQTTLAGKSIATRGRRWWRCELHVICELHVATLQISAGASIAGICVVGVVAA